MIHLKPNGDQEIISPFWQQPKKKSDRQYWIDMCVALTGRPFIFWASQFRGLEVQFIKDLYLKSQETNSDKVKYFWKLLRDSKLR